MPRVRTKPGRASYRFGVEWIAENDEWAETDPQEIAGFISTLLLADLFGKHPLNVAQDIATLRLRRPAP
jgi:hypothetical protein